MKNLSIRSLTGLFAGIFFLCSSTAAFALTDAIGEVVYLDGQVQILRNAKLVSGRDISFGTVIQNFDQIRVVKNGQVEVQLYDKTGIGGSIIVKSGGVISFDLSSLRSQQSGNVDLLKGSVQLKIKKLATGNQLNVRTGTANMGVRGTEFEVEFAVNGDTLLSTSEGRVECQADGKTLFSAPGSVVQGSADGNWNSVPVAVSSLAEFKRKWIADRIDAFKADPGRATAQFASLYLEYKTRFDAAYDELFRQRDVMQKWIKEEMDGNIGSTAERNREKLKLITALKKIRVVGFLFERVYFRLQQLDELYKQGIAATGQVKRGLSVAAFFRQFNEERDVLGQKMADINFVIKLYAKRNEGTFPFDVAGSSMGNADSMFANENSFFGN